MFHRLLLFEKALFSNFFNRVNFIISRKIMICHALNKYLQYNTIFKVYLVSPNLSIDELPSPNNLHGFFYIVEILQQISARNYIKTKRFKFKIGTMLQLTAS